MLLVVRSTTEKKREGRNELHSKRKNVLTCILTASSHVTQNILLCLCRQQQLFRASPKNSLPVSVVFQKISGARFSKDPVTVTGPESDFDIEVSRKVERVLTSDEVHLVFLADNFTLQFSNLLKLPLEWKTKQLNGPGNYRELQETGPWSAMEIQLAGKLVIALCWYHFSQLSIQELWFHTDTGRNTRVIPVHKAVEKVGQDVCNLLPVMHAVRGCDSTSNLPRVTA